jgi:hypothetical protein
VLIRLLCLVHGVSIADWPSTKQHAGVVSQTLVLGAFHGIDFLVRG